MSVKRTELKIKTSHTELGDRSKGKEGVEKFMIVRWPSGEWMDEYPRFLNNEEYKYCDRFIVWAKSAKAAKAKAQRSYRASQSAELTDAD